MDISASGFAKMGSDLSGFDKKLAQAAKEAQKEEAAFAEHLAMHEKELMNEMQSIKGDDISALSGSQVGAIVGSGSTEIGSAAAAYALEMEENRKAMEKNMESGKIGQANAYKRQREALIKQRDEVDANFEEMKAAKKALDDQMSHAQEERDGAAEYNDKLRAQIEKLKELEGAASQQEELKKLKQLVGLNESLKAQEKAFKESCKTQMADLKAKLAAVESGDDEDSEENAKLKDIEEMHTKMLAKYNRLRQMLAETNLEVANSSRHIDDIPTRSELIQYERRFTELYSQVAWKLDETRKYYALYNTLDSKLEFLQKEVKLLNSISDNFSAAMSSSSSKAEFLQQFENIVKGVEMSSQQQETVATQREQRLDQLKSVHQNVSTVSFLYHFCIIFVSFWSLTRVSSICHHILSYH
jgi:DNA repair exonuclease SbcCD ATPase subunit